jgi:predicted nucleic acid-binding protein
MKVYYDTGILLKLYTIEPESAAVRDFVRARNERIVINALHRSECVSAFRLKAFRGECDEVQATRAIADFEDDITNGIFQLLSLNWDETWNLCREFSNTHAQVTGCRTLDAVHVACARLWGCREFVSSDKRQCKLARLVGMKIIELF